MPRWEATWDEDLEKALKRFKTRDDFLKKEWPFHMTAEAMMVCMSLTSIEVEAETAAVPNYFNQLAHNPRLHGKIQMINDWQKRLNDLDVSFPEFYQKTGMEILKKGLHRMRRISADENDVFRIEHKITWISQLNFCFQPTFAVDVPIKSQGQFLFFQTKLDLEKLAGVDLPCMSLDVHGRPSDWVRHMGGSAAGKDGVADNLCPGQYAEIRVEVKAVHESLPSDSPARACEELSADGKNDYDCRLQCRIEYVRSLCDCTPLSLSYLVEDKKELAEFPLCNYTACNYTMESPPAGEITAERACIKKCKRDCRQTRYTITRSNAKKTLALNEKHKQSIGRDLITVSVTWGSFEYLLLEQDWKYTPVAFAAALGGAIGIYLGLSVLTLIVGVVYGADLAFKYSSGYWKDRQQSRRVKNRDNDHRAARPSAPAPSPPVSTSPVAE
ncbi:Amiloride-sensitive sodium channel subunit beta [Aphelenchoides fujianensis]|nr:Amiloride-sensitive sodium channel subunit beta [Aphelenchoides fujianensis]